MKKKKERKLVNFELNERVTKHSHIFCFAKRKNASEIFFTSKKTVNYKAPTIAFCISANISKISIFIKW